MQIELDDKRFKSAHYIRKLKSADQEIHQLKESMNEQLMKKELQLLSMDINVQNKKNQISALHKNRLTRTAIVRLFSRAKIDTQRAFFFLKMNAHESRLIE